MTTGWHAASRASGRVTPAVPGSVPMTASSRASVSSSLASLMALKFSPKAFASATAFSAVRFSTRTSAKPICLKAYAAARAVPPAPRMRPTRRPGRASTLRANCPRMPNQSVLSPLSRPVPGSFVTVLTAPISRADSLSSSMCSNSASLWGMVTAPPPVEASDSFQSTPSTLGASYRPKTCGAPLMRKPVFWIVGDAESATGWPKM
mmetsp:Transcript_7686/g.23368  ORF Transcript_7686/g.23368 Transcript_7686/m.23368 type:complete len:206 (+) Transcript_7686:362-979(+)